MQKVTHMLGLAGLVLFLFGLITYLFTGDFAGFSGIHLLLGGIFLIYWLLVHIRSLGDFVRGRALRTFGETAGTAFFALVIAVSFNLIATVYPKQFDWTKDQLYSLSSQTKNTLQQLKEPLKALFFQQGGMAPAAEDILKLYQYEQANFSYQIIDPDRSPELAQQYEIRQNATLVLELGARTQKLTQLDEENITNAILQLMAGQKTAIGFLTNHQERTLSNENHDDPGAISILGLLLAEENYVVEPVSIIEQGNVPDHIQLLVIAAPTQKLLPAEIEAITKFLKKNKALLVLADPLRPLDPSLAAMLAIKTGSNVILDQSVQLFSGPTLGTQILTETVAEHPLTQLVQTKMVFQEVCSLALPQESDSTTWQPLLRSSDVSWAESDLDRLLEKQEAEQGKDDVAGPVTFAATFQGFSGEVTALEGEQRARGAVICDSDFLSNRQINELGNADFTLNLIAWLAGDTQKISIRPKSRQTNQITMTEDQMVNTFYVTVLLVPEILLLLGLFVWYRRRQR